MVARLVRLRVALLGAAFRGRLSEVLRRMALGALALLAALTLAWLPEIVAGGSDRAQSVSGFDDLEVVLGGLVLAVPVLIPFFANQRHLEPRQFAHLPVRPAQLATALLSTTVLSWPALWLLAWLVPTVVLLARQGAPAWVLILTPLSAALLAISGARLASGASKLFLPGRGRGILRVIGLLALIAVLPVVIFAVAQSLRTPGNSMTADAAEVLGWSPFGAPFAAAAAAATGDAAGAMARLGIVFGTCAILVLLWYPLVRRSMEQIEPPLDSTVARDGLGWFERFPARPAAVIGARVLTYWARDPRYRIAFIAIPLAPVVMIVSLLIAGVGIEAVALVPLPVILLLLGWSIHNDVATDSTAIWMHVASGTRGRDDRQGRLFPVLLIGLPLVLIGSSVSVIIAGDWRVLPAVLGLNLAVLLVACAVASVFSVLMPYPTTRPGDSPFAQPNVSGSGAGLSQTLSMVFAVLFAIPPLWASVAAMVEPTFVANVFALVFGSVYGVVVLLGGIVLGGARFDRRSAELLAVTQTFD